VKGVRLVAEPQDCMEFRIHIKRGSSGTHCQQHWRSYLLTLEVLSRISQPPHREFGTPCEKIPSVRPDIGIYRVKPEDRMVSFDSVSLFTEVPIVDSLELLSHHFEDDVLALFTHVLTSTYFCFDRQFYEQTDWVAMGLPLSPVITKAI